MGGKFHFITSILLVLKKNSQGHFTFSRIGGDVWRPKGVCQRKKGVQGGCER